MPNARARVVLISATLCFLVGCVNSEKKDAIRLAKLLNSKSPILGQLNSQESQALSSLQQWSGQEAAMGGPMNYFDRPQPQQRQASANARASANQLSVLGSNLQSIIQEFTALELKASYNQTVRSGIVQTLQSRKSFYGELQPLLEGYATGILNPNLEPFTRPTSIDTIVSKVRTYQPPSNGIAQALQELRTKYSISDSDLAN